MKLIIVRRSSVATYRRLIEKFADDRGVKVVLERRMTPERVESAERRRLKKAFEGRDYLVVHLVDEKLKT
jgi:hypothetical protein